MPFNASILTSILRLRSGRSGHSGFAGRSGMHATYQAMLSTSEWGIFCHFILSVRSEWIYRAIRLNPVVNESYNKDIH